MEYIKHFNQESEKYLCYRPDYPQNLFTYLSTLANPNEYVWVVEQVMAKLHLH